MPRAAKQRPSQLNRDLCNTLSSGSLYQMLGIGCYFGNHRLYPEALLEIHCVGLQQLLSCQKGRVRYKTAANTAIKHVADLELAKALPQALCMNSFHTESWCMDKMWTVHAEKCLDFWNACFFSPFLNTSEFISNQAQLLMLLESCPQK